MISSWQEVERQGDYIIGQHHYFLPSFSDKSVDVYSVYYQPEGQKRQSILGSRATLEEAENSLEEYIQKGGYEKWENLPALLSSDTSYQGWDLDPNVKEVVADLNDRGFTTTGSCSGHGRRGYVVFDDLLDEDEKAEVKEVLEMNDIMHSSFEDDRNRTMIFFESLD